MKQLLIYCIALTIVQPGRAMHTKYSHKHYQLIDAAEKRKDLREYIRLIEKILPDDISHQITEKWIGTLLKTEAIKKKHTIHPCLKIDNVYNLNKPILAMSPNGDYFIHNVVKNFTDSQFTLCNTHHHRTEYTFKSSYKVPVYFSPHNNYIITREWDGVFFYHIKNQQKHRLLDNQKVSCDVIINSDGTYILHEGRDAIAESMPFYTLWKLDQSNRPHEIALKNNLMGSYSALFHLNNTQLYLTNRNLQLYDIATQQITPLNLSEIDGYISLVHDLTFSPDKTHMICDAWIQDDQQYMPRYALLNVQDHEDVTTTEIPAASLAKQVYLTPLCIAYSHFVTHVCNEGKTLQLLDEHMKCIGSHNAPAHSHITTLATDHTGTYLASGYSDGTIVLWDIPKSHKKIRGKKLIGSRGTIKKLTFTNNHLLLSQSKYDQTLGTAILWDTQGNEVMNFGNSVLKGKISKNGKKLVVLYADLDNKNKTLMCYNLDVPIENHTLTQGYTLLQKYTTQKVLP